MKCKVKISYDTAGMDGYETSGVLQYENGGFCLGYGFDGDECQLAYDGAVLKQSRRGKMRTDITFISGKQTDCFTADEEQGYSCVLKVCTRSIDYSKNGNGLSLKINYEIEDNPIILNFTAEIIKEKK